MHHFRLPASILCLVVLLTPQLRAEKPAEKPAAKPFRYTEGKYGPAELKYANGLPVLTVEGTPEEMGEQAAALAHQASKAMMSFPKAYLDSMKIGWFWPVLVTNCKKLEPQIPADHLAELDAIVKKAGVDREIAIVGNTFTDVKKIGGCCTLIAESNRSATKGPLFGRNLDYPTLGFLQDYSLVTVYRPKGKHAFASVGFPGFIGVLSGINDAGLALAILEVDWAGDDSTAFDSKGVPYALSYRRVLEECATVAEAEKLLTSMKRTTRTNLAICDPNGGAVFEITPKSLVVRRPEDGYSVCTNHFRTAELGRETKCRRYSLLSKCRKDETIDLARMRELLDAANQGELTLQTMIFEPATLKLHLSIGKCPASALEPKTLALEPYFKKKADKE